MSSKEIADFVASRCDECGKIAPETYTVKVENARWRYNDRSETRSVENRDVCLSCLTKAGIVSWVKVVPTEGPRSWWRRWLRRS